MIAMADCRVDGCDWVGQDEISHLKMKAVHGDDDHEEAYQKHLDNKNNGRSTGSQSSTGSSVTEYQAPDTDQGSDEDDDRPHVNDLKELDRSEPWMRAALNDGKRYWNPDTEQVYGPGEVRGA